MFHVHVCAPGTAANTATVHASYARFRCTQVALNIVAHQLYIKGGTSFGFAGGCPAAWCRAGDNDKGLPVCFTLAVVSVCRAQRQQCTRLLPACVRGSFVVSRRLKAD